MSLVLSKFGKEVPKISNVSLVSFDVTGTLIGYAVTLGDVFTRLIEYHGIHVSKDSKHVESQFKKSYQQIRARWPNFGSNHHIATKDWWRSVVYLTLLGTGVECSNSKMEQIFNAIYGEFSTTRPYHLYPDTLPTLKALNAMNIKMAIISNNDERCLDLLDAFDIRRYFDTIIISKEVQCEKPDPLIYEILMKRTGVQAQRILHIGDSEINDYLGPRRLNLHALRCMRYDTSLESSSQTNRTHIVRDVASILDIIQK